MYEINNYININKSIAESLGPEYSEVIILDLDATWAESEPRTPLICILSIGSDPSPQITALAKQKEICKCIILLVYWFWEPLIYKCVKPCPFNLCIFNYIMIGQKVIEWVYLGMIWDFQWWCEYWWLICCLVYYFGYVPCSLWWWKQYIPLKHWHTAKILNGMTT